MRILRPRQFSAQKKIEIAAEITFLRIQPGRDAGIFFDDQSDAVSELQEAKAVKPRIGIEVPMM